MDKHRGYIRIIIGAVLLYLSKEPADMSMILGIMIGTWGMRDLIYKDVIPYIHRRGWGIHHEENNNT